MSKDQNKFVDCALCGCHVDRRNAIVKAGWEICKIHQVFVKPSLYKSRCHFCFKEIVIGQVILLHKDDVDNPWTVLHRKEDCKKDPTLLRNFNSNSPYAKLYLTDDAPIDVVRLVYKVLAFKNHPDRGGDADKMKEINAALNEITGR